MASSKNIITDNALTELISKIKTWFSNINVAYGVCNTAANVSAKEITITSDGDFKLKVGARICVKYTNTNTASNCTINVNNTGAKPVWYSNYEYTYNGNYVLGTAGLVIQYVYDGTYWVWMGKSFDVNTTYSTATTSSSGLMSAADKVKLDGIASNATKITVDTALSSSSTNPVQNKVVNTALANKADLNHTHSNATTTASGLMSKTDKAKLDELSVPKIYSVSVPASAWVSGDSYSTATITLAACTTAWYPIVFLDTDDATSDTLSSLTAAFNSIVSCTTGAGDVTFKLVGDIPEVDLSLRLYVSGATEV